MSGTIRFLGHAFVEFTTRDGKVILFDPWTKDAGSPSCPVTVDEIKKADLVLISHDHFDHAGSAVAICKKTGALLGGAAQTMGRLIGEGFDAGQVVNFGMGYMPGGGVSLDWVQVIAIPAFHASDSGVAIGAIVKAADGTTVYHAGDTGLFSDMGLYARLYPIEVAMLPIGGVFTMDAYLASEAVKMIQPKMVVPIHYASFPMLAQTADDFIAQCAKKTPGVKVTALGPGEKVDF